MVQRARCRGLGPAFPSSVFLLAPLLVWLAGSPALAGRDHCRNINFGGAGGEGSHDIVVIQMVDEDGSTILDQSCPIQVGGGETAKQFAERIPAWWRCNPKSDVPCPLSGCPDSDYVTNVYTKPSGRFKLPKKLCGDVSPGDQHSCKIKFVYKLDKATGLPKKGPQLKICCKAGDECKGPKWGKDPVQGIPVNVQSKSSGISNDFLPTTLSLPVMVGEDTDIVVDPISVRQLPFSGLAGCRDVVAKQVFKLTRTILDTLVSCHADPTVSPASLCNSVVSADFDGAVAAAELALSEAVLSGCTDVGSPAKLAYSECPAPCDFLPFTPPVCTVGANLGSPCVKHSDCDDAGLCVAGKIGSSCGVDRDCDSTEGAGDGSCEGVVSGVCQNLCTAPVARVGDPCVRSSDCDVMPGDGECGNWQEAADCVSCLAREALEAEITELFGESGSSIVERDSRQLSGAARACKDALGQASAELTVKQLRQTIKCQKLFDRGKISLGGSAEKCKNADLKGKRSVAIGAAQSAIAQACSDAAVLELDTCGTNVSELSTCAVAAVETVTGGLAEAATPESRCGDGRRVDEQCDDGNGVSGDGCSPDCLCEGTCGDGVLNPLLVCGEFCDDGNDIDGDGCDSNCTPTGCGNSIVTAGEQCDGPSDDACPGQCRSDCRCPGSGFCGDGVVESGEQCDGGPCCTPSCTFEASGVSCSSDGDVCNGTETCDGAGSCQPGSPLQCADQNPCTTESCDPVIGCVTELNDNASCDDNDLCTTNDSCLGGLCVGGAPPNCDDSNPCTDDSCDPVSGGCANVANTASCDDGDPCTIGDTCSGGLCAGGAPPNCDDSNPCTDDSCDPASGGCVNVANTASCDDGDPCTIGDTCSGGLCAGGAPPNCDDSNPCTDDFCDPASGGCANVANTASCDDGDPCTVGDLCAAGACAGGALAPDCRSLSPVNQALVPCDPTVLDRYVFDVVAGEDVLISADTVDSVTAADLAFDGNCGSSVFFSGDDEIVCTFPPPTFDCPETSFVAVASGTCTVDVTEATFDCTDPARANYVLTIVRDGQPALITLVNDNVPN